MARTIFDKIHLSSVTDGDWRILQLDGLSRLSPFLYIGGAQLGQVTINGYYDCPDIAQFRVAVREIRPKPHGPPLTPLGGGEANLHTVEKELSAGIPEWNAYLACPNLFDIDTRNLYFGQLNQQPLHAKLKAGQESTPPWNSAKVLAGEEEIGPEGRSVKGMPVRLQQVHFKAYNPDDKWGHHAAESGDEFAAYFLVSNPVGPIPETCPPPPAICIDSDFNLQREGGVVYWTHNRWTITGSEKDAEIDWTKRLVMGQKSASQELFDILTAALADQNVTHVRQETGFVSCLPRIVTHVYAGQCGLNYNYVELKKATPQDGPENVVDGIKWKAGVNAVIEFTDCEDSGSCTPSSTVPHSCPQPSAESCPSYGSTSLIPSGANVVGGGQIGCPRDYCPGMEQTADDDDGGDGGYEVE